MYSAFSDYFKQIDNNMIIIIIMASFLELVQFADQIFSFLSHQLVIQIHKKIMIKP